ncbi:CotH kinase family protein [Bacteroidota bacterium]
MLLIFSYPCISESQIILNEIMATNASAHMETDFYNFPDWVEIYNNGSSGEMLSGYYISDNKDELKKWQLPSVSLDSNEYYFVYCDEKATGNHTNFGLSAGGEKVYLCDNAGNIVDSVTYPKLYPNISFGRNSSDNNQWLFCATPTPGENNITTNAVTQASEVKYSIPAGVINSSIDLTLEGENIRYTTNGAEPDSNSSNYTQAININKTTIVKSKIIHDDSLPGETYANTYFYNEHNFTLPVVSLSFTPDYFYDDDIGIHVEGKNGIAGNCGKVANWNQPWERPAYLEYFDENGIKQISQQVGVKVAGGCTRGRAQKSLSVYARSKYGDNDFDYPLFVEKPDIQRYKSFVLRNSGNDQDQTLLRDAFIQSLVKNSMDIDYQAYQPAIVYFNGEYRGIMNLREKADEDYFESNYSIDSDEIDFLEGILWCTGDNCYDAIRGSNAEYLDLISFISSNSLANDDNYNLVASQLDLQEYINYMVVQTYIGNRDWPGNNLKFWKIKENGKWRWILFDTDYGFGFRLNTDPHAYESFDVATATDGESHPNPPWSTILFRKLLKNEKFKKQFIRTFITHMNSSFHPDWCDYVLDSLSSIIDDEISYNQQKFGRTKSEWQGYLDVIKENAKNRYDFMPGYLMSFFNLEEFEVTVTVTNPNSYKGKVEVNNAVVNHYPFNMETYKDFPLSIKILPKEGYTFNYWKMNEEIYSEDIELNSDSSFNISIEPVFEGDNSMDNIFLHEFANNFKIYPNPSSGEFYLSIADIDIYENNYLIELIDISGKLISPRIWINNANAYFDLSYLNNGFYIARIYKDNQLIISMKFIIRK